MNCPLCKCRECKDYPNFVQNSTLFECSNCGHFILTAGASSEIADDGWKLAAYVVDQYRRGNTPTFHACQRSLPPDAHPGSVGVDAIIESFPKSVAERLDRALINLANATHNLGQTFQIQGEISNPLLLAQNGQEVFFVIQQLGQEGYIKGNITTLPTGISLTAKGFNRAADLQRGLFGPGNKQVFVAMSFDKSLNDTWADGLKLGIEDCGFEALRVDRKQHNEKICDVIVAEIRKSKFLVADFTLHRNGVYFEAGMMMGLGRPVIFTCRKDELGKAHFDTRQYFHIEWETPDELRSKLKSRIQATIIL